MRAPPKPGRKRTPESITKRIEAIDGTRVSVRADSLCVHGDSPHAVAMARAVRDALAVAGVEVAARA